MVDTARSEWGIMHRGTRAAATAAVAVLTVWSSSMPAMSADGGITPSVQASGPQRGSYVFAISGTVDIPPEILRQVDVNSRDGMFVQLVPMDSSAKTAALLECPVKGLEPTRSDFQPNLAFRTYSIACSGDIAERLQREEYAAATGSYADAYVWRLHWVTYDSATQVLATHTTDVTGALPMLWPVKDEPAVRVSQLSPRRGTRVRVYPTTMWTWSDGATTFGGSTCGVDAQCIVFTRVLPNGAWRRVGTIPAKGRSVVVSGPVQFMIEVDGQATPVTTVRPR